MFTFVTYGVGGAGEHNVGNSNLICLYVYAKSNLKEAAVTTLRAQPECEHFCERVRERMRESVRERERVPVRVQVQGQVQVWAHE